MVLGFVSVKPNAQAQGAIASPLQWKDAKEVMRKEVFIICHDPMPSSTSSTVETINSGCQNFEFKLRATPYSIAVPKLPKGELLMNQDFLLLKLKPLFNEYVKRYYGSKKKHINKELQRIAESIDMMYGPASDPIVTDDEGAFDAFLAFLDHLPALVAEQGMPVYSTVENKESHDRVKFLCRDSSCVWLAVVLSTKGTEENLTDLTFSEYSVLNQVIDGEGGIILSRGVFSEGKNSAFAQLTNTLHSWHGVLDPGATMTQIEKTAGELSYLKTSCFDVLTLRSKLNSYKWREQDIHWLCQAAWTITEDSNPKYSLCLFLSSSTVTDGNELIKKCRAIQ